MISVRKRFFISLEMTTFSEGLEIEGIETFNRIQKDKPLEDIPIVVITASTDIRLFLSVVMAKQRSSLKL